VRPHGREPRLVTDLIPFAEALEQHQASHAVRVEQRVGDGGFAPDRKANQGEAVETERIGEGAVTDITRPLLAVTLGGVRELGVWRGFEGGLGADVTFYGVPAPLAAAYSRRPISFHLFFRLRPPAGAMGRMWNMRMSQPMPGHRMDAPMHHQMP